VNGRPRPRSTGQDTYTHYLHPSESIGVHLWEHSGADNDGAKPFRGNQYGFEAAYRSERRYQGGMPVKVHDFAHQVAMRTIELLEEKQHYKVSEENRKEILKLIRGEVNTLLDRAS
jgi:hypothetical protein